MLALPGKGQLRSYKYTQVHGVTMNNEKVHTGYCRPATVSLRDIRTMPVFCKEVRDVGLLGETAGAGDGSNEFSQFYNLREYKGLLKYGSSWLKGETILNAGILPSVQKSPGMSLFSSIAYFLTPLACLGKNGFSTQFNCSWFEQATHNALNFNSCL